MLQYIDSDNTNHDVSSESNSILPQPVLSNIYTDWNINETEGFQGNVPQHKEYNFASFPCNCSSISSSFGDPTWNMGYQFSGNQYTPTACCLFDQQIKKQTECSPVVLSELDPFLVKDIDNSTISSKQSSNTSGDCRIPSCMQPQQLPGLPLCNTSYQAQDSSLPQFSTNNYSYCYETDCLDKLCNSSKNIYSSCILDQNLGITNIREENMSRVNADLSTFIPMNDSDNTILNVNETDDESDIIVEDSDTESEISIDVGPYISEKEVEKETVMRCFVCNLLYTEKVEFVQVNSSFPLTFISQTPVMLKLIEVIPIDMQTSVKFENNLICKRCLNLIDMVEQLEVRLISVKKVLCDFVCRSSKDMPDEDWSLVQQTNEISKDDNIAPLKNIENLLSKEVKSTSDNAADGAKVKTSNETDESAKNLNNSTITGPCLKVHSVRDTSCLDLKSNNVDNVVITDLNKTSNELAKISHNVNHTVAIVEEGQELNKKLLIEKIDCNSSELSKIIPETKKIEHTNQAKHQCDRCGKLYRREKELRYHMKRHEGIFKEKCTHCDKGFIKKSNLEIHLRKHRNHICITCRASFVSDVELENHSKICTENKVSCSKCKQVFQSENKLRAHMEKHKVELNLCTICNKSFKHPSHLLAHMKSHSDEKPFSCEKCGRNYKNNNHLRRHLRSHDVSLKCAKCNKVFLFPKDLKLHLRIHEEEVECEICKKKYSKKNIAEHKRIHTNNRKRKECPVCKKMLTTNMKLHMSKHAETKEFKCEVCSVEFTFRHSLTKHMRLKHTC